MYELILKEVSCEYLLSWARVSRNNGEKNVHVLSGEYLNDLQEIALVGLSIYFCAPVSWTAGVYRADKLMPIGR